MPEEKKDPRFSHIQYVITCLRMEIHSLLIHINFYRILVILPQPITKNPKNEVCHVLGREKKWEKLILGQLILKICNFPFLHFHNSISRSREKIGFVKVTYITRTNHGGL